MTKKLARWLLFTIVFCGGMLWLADGWRSPLLLAYVAGMSAIFCYALLAMTSDLAKERFHPAEPGIDAGALLWVRLTALATLIVSPLDGGRLHWSPAIPDGIRAAAMIGSLAAFLFCFRAMLTNRFFSPVVRIQNDRGHEVVDRGPYAVIRHPGYLGMITGVPLMAIGFGSWFGLVFATAYGLLILYRVAYEDRFLQQNLPGYRDYAARVTARLVPGLW